MCTVEVNTNKQFLLHLCHSFLNAFVWNFSAFCCCLRYKFPLKCDEINCIWFIIHLIRFGSIRFKRWIGSFSWNSDCGFYRENTNSLVSISMVINQPLYQEISWALACQCDLMFAVVVVAVVKFTRINPYRKLQSQ